MVTILQILFVLALLILLVMFVLKPNQQIKEIIPMPENYVRILEEYVIFYQKLDENEKRIFEQRVQNFLSEIRITGINTTVEDIDKVLIGDGAIIPIFDFPDWEYINLHEVLLYPDSFNEEFEQEGYNRPVMGMVGSGALQHVMILSKPALREGFRNATGKTNTAIHEFVHLIDKTDGDINGIPGILLQHQYTLPWLNLMHSTILKMRRGESDIDLYGVTSQSEFFAVVSEYFFQRPDLLKENHPELYEMLERMFRPAT